MVVYVMLDTLSGALATGWPQLGYVRSALTVERSKVCSNKYSY